VRYSWHWGRTSPTGAWIAGAVFFVTGLVMGIAVPAWLTGGSDGLPTTAALEAALLFRITGWTFTGLGSLVLGLMTIGLWIGVHGPDRLRVWHWWVGFVGGLVGALLFAVPAVLAYPFLYYMGRRPAGALFSDMGRSPEDMWTGALFSALGVVVLLVLVPLARHRVRGRPR